VGGDHNNQEKTGLSNLMRIFKVRINNCYRAV
jgi:hypothetical protein